MNVTINNRSMAVSAVEAIEGALAESLVARGFEPAFYTLVGKRGGFIVCLRSAKTGEFSKF